MPGLDSDQDGVADELEDVNRNGLLDPGEMDPDHVDTDRDHTPDGAELRTGTNPLDPDSSFKVSLRHAAGGVDLLWPSAPGARYQLEWNPDLQTGEWGVMVEDVNASLNGSTTSFPLSFQSVPSGVYRLILK